MSAPRRLTSVGEVPAPILVIIGFWTRAAAFVIAINMVFAVVLVHIGQLVELAPEGGWVLELQALFVVAVLGAGRYSLGGITERRN